MNETIAAAIAERPAEPATQRLFDGGGDGIPGLVIERFGDDVTPPAYRLRGPPGLVEVGLAAAQHFPSDAVFTRFGHAHETGPDDGERVIVEGGLRYAVRLHGQRNTGLFLDARPARAWVREHAAERRILNLFAYTCGFGVAAAAGQARSTVNVDVASPVLARGRDNYALNDLSSDTRTFWRSDAREALQRAKKSARFDGIVLDPPPQAQGRGRQRYTPSKDLPKVIRQSLALLDPGGWLLLLTPDDPTPLFAEVEGEFIWRGGSGDDFRPRAERRLYAYAFQPR